MPMQEIVSSLNEKLDWLNAYATHFGDSNKTEICATLKEIKETINTLPALYVSAPVALDITKLEADLEQSK